MIFVIFALTFLSFLQATLLPVSFTLLLIICRSFITDDSKNFWLAFLFGLLLSLLLGLPLGSLSFIYLLMIVFVKVFKSAQPTSHWLMIFPLGVTLLVINHLLQSLILGSSLNLPSLVPAVLLIIPTYLLVRFWEDRFTSKGDLRLKVRK